MRFSGERCHHLLHSRLPSATMAEANLVKANGFVSANQFFHKRSSTDMHERARVIQSAEQTARVARLSVASLATGRVCDNQLERVAECKRSPDSSRFVRVPFLGAGSNPAALTKLPSAP